MFEDTICAPASPIGSAAISVIRVSGPDALDAVDKLVVFRRGIAAESKGFEVKFGVVPNVDDVLVSVYRAPHSYTGEHAAEIGCHASPYIVSVILQRLIRAGCRMAEPGEFTKRAFLNGKMDLAQAEAVADLIAADSQASHRLAFAQMKGRYSEEFRELRAQLVELASLVELELDFSEEEVEFADRGKLAGLLEQARTRIEALMASYRVGNAVKTGVPVAIAGAPNSGKSTLLNALLCEDRAIVSDIPGTTRDTVEETMVVDGVRYRFIDTAGLRESDDTIEKLGIERSIDKLRSAAIILAVLDATATPQENLASAKTISAELSPDQKVLWILNKSDIAPRDPAIVSENIPDLIGDLHAITGDTLRISALNGTGLDELRDAITECGYGTTEDAVVTSARHYSALCEAAEDLARVSDALNKNLSGDLLAEDLRAAISTLGSIFGEITTDDLLGEIFSKFCIGK
ncbi:MAG: tRNA uridine-5-carboxymethylaminomethyl(34) synthesis GTPase MnmE [Bacteroidales bacterium]|nr:tRNA uridine-5-carboxymethylaminomethyl(34) synthesis GTPase MnmE [Bacteroidales bacterium]